MATLRTFTLFLLRPIGALGVALSFCIAFGRDIRPKDDLGSFRVNLLQSSQLVEAWGMAPG